MPTAATPRSRHTGIEVRHARSCPSAGGGRCSCLPTYRASVYSKREKRTIRKAFHNLAEAKAWRADAQGAVRKGALTGTSTATLSQAAAAWVAGAAAGAIRNRSGDVYKPASFAATSRVCDSASSLSWERSRWATCVGRSFKTSSIACCSTAGARRRYATRCFP